MSPTLLLLLGLLAFAEAQIEVPLPVPPPPAEGMVRVSTSWTDGILEIWDIERARYDARPVWIPAAGPVPLTLTEAIKAGEALLTRQHPDVKAWFPMNTSLVRDADGRAWAYKFTVGDSVGGPGNAGRFSLMVLLDGSILEPQRIQGPPMTMNTASQQPVQDPAGVYRVGAGVIAPVVAFSPKPKYTAAAMRARIQGVVRLSCVVNTDGLCEDIKIVQSLDTDNGLDDEAMNSLRQWRFRSGTRDGQPVKVFVNVDLWFNLGGKQ